MWRVSFLKEYNLPPGICGFWSKNRWRRKWEDLHKRVCKISMWDIPWISIIGYPWICGRQCWVIITRCSKFMSILGQSTSAIGHFYREQHWQIELVCIAWWFEKGSFKLNDSFIIYQLWMQGDVPCLSRTKSSDGFHCMSIFIQAVCALQTIHP